MSIKEAILKALSDGTERNYGDIKDAVFAQELKPGGAFLTVWLDLKAKGMVERGKKFGFYQITFKGLAELANETKDP